MLDVLNVNNISGIRFPDKGVNCQSFSYDLGCFGCFSVGFGLQVSYKGFLKGV